MLRSGARVLAVLLWLPLSALAQQNATVQGSAVDKSKGVLPGVSVTATEINTGRATVAVTTEEGRFRFENPPPGSYKLRFELTGFTVVEIPQIDLLVGTNASVPAVTLRVASRAADAPNPDRSRRGASRAPETRNCDVKSNRGWHNRSRRMVGWTATRWTSPGT